MAILGVISWIVIGKETQKLGAVSDSLEKVSSGDLRIADLPITSADEFGTLAGALNNMKQKLCTLVKNVAFSAEQVAASSQELTASSAQTADSINQVALNTVNITEEVATQESTIGELQQQIEGMTNEITEIRNGAVSMSKAANASRENAREGRQKVDFAVKQITGIAEQVNKSAQVVRDLGKRSDEIGTIVERQSAALPNRRICLH